MMVTASFKISVPQNAIDIELCLRITRQIPKGSLRDNDTRSFEKAVLKLGLEISCTRFTVLLTENFSSESWQNGGVLCGNVS